MSPTPILDKILLMLRSFEDKPEQLEKLYQYMLDELYIEDKPGGDIVVPKRYAQLVKEAADSLSAAMVCYINPGTLEKIDIPHSVIDTMIFDDEENEENEMGEDDPFYADMKRIKRDWEQSITITPPESHESFSFLEQSINTRPQSRTRKALSGALSGRKPFSHFNHIIHQSDEREAWFAFRQKCLEKYVAEILSGKLWNDEAGNS